MNIGENIRKRREELGMSQLDLAKMIGVTQGSIGNYESGVSNPKMELLPKIFEALNIDANYLFGKVKPEDDYKKNSPSPIVRKNRDELYKEIVELTEPEVDQLEIFTGYLLYRRGG